MSTKSKSVHQDFTSLSTDIAVISKIIFTVTATMASEHSASAMPASQEEVRDISRTPPLDDLDD